MRLTTKGRFAVTAMIDLGMRHERGPVTLAGISERQQISLSYLEQLFAQLRRNGLVESVRGPGGGYRLARKNHLLSVSDIIDSVNERIDATRCDGRGDCQQGATCLTHHLWVELSENLHEFLRGITIADLIRDNAARMDHTTSEQSVADV